MGNNNSTTGCELQECSDVCQMVSCLDISNGSIKGLPVDSASPTDTWIVKFKEGTTYDRKPIEKAFLKCGFLTLRTKT